MRAKLAILALLLAAIGPWALPVRVLTTGDMHGWIESQPAGEQTLGGAAEMLAAWQRNEGYAPEKFLVLSAGDIATGPAISTAFRGDPAVAVMNLMGYDASAVGNHEFDFRVEQLAVMAKAARFPFLAANLAMKDATPPPFAAPYALLDAEGVKVAVVGLAPRDLQTLSNYAGAVTVHAYLESLKKATAAARAEGAQVVILLAHAGQKDLETLAGQAKDLGIPLMIGGHTHELSQRKVGDTWVMCGDEWWHAYGRVDMDFDPVTKKTTVLSAKQVWLQQAKPAADAAVAAEVAVWRDKLAVEYGVQIAYTKAGILRKPALFNLVPDAFLAADPTADVALTNDGSLRQDIPAGPITKGTIVGLMPFVNTLLRISLTGEQLLTYLPKTGTIGVAGLVRKAGAWTVVKTGKPIDPKASYEVLLNNYMYDTSTYLKAADPAPIEVSPDWKQPVMDWLQAHPTTEVTPLEGMIDATPRI
jgi:2',3'-cyclic-nucleotide 2'-phosphodiesterase (5'-nucleotidase family)